MAAVEGRVFSFIDLGTNSVRMMTVRLNPNMSFTVLGREKEAVRLGENGFMDGNLRRDAMDRTVLVCRKFAELARTRGSEDIEAVATSAARDARNRNELISRLKEEAGIDLGVISGMEEARLIYLGVSSGLDLGDRTALFIDIGGGSTELALGGRERHHFLDSVKLGAIRLTSKFVEEGGGPVDDATYEIMRKHARALLARPARIIADKGFDLALGSSGTIANLAEVAARMTGGDPSVVTLTDLARASAALRAMTLDERRKVPGINPERADIIVAGAAILESAMGVLGIQQLKVSPRGVVDGMLADRLSRVEGHPRAAGLSAREASVLQLARSCDVDEEHAATVARLAMELFDSSKRAGLHSLDDGLRELLGHTALLHDVGGFISYEHRQAHSHYIISHADLLGFDEGEKALMANVARYHRKKPPKTADAAMEPGELEAVAVLSCLLRLAEDLDRSRTGLVRDVRLEKDGKSGAVLEAQVSGDPSLELWGVEGDAKAFKRAFGRSLRAEMVMVPLEQE